MNSRRATICSQSNFATDYRVEKMRRTLSSLGYSVTLLGRNHPREGRRGGGHTQYMRLLTWRGPLFYLELNVRLFLRLLLGGRQALVVSIDLDTLPGCLAAARLRGFRLVWDSHELFPEVPEIAHKAFVRRTWWHIQDFCVPCLRPGDIGVTVCQSIADILQERYGRRFLVVRNAPARDRQEAVAEARRGGGASRPFTLLYQGAVNIGRGVEEAIEALAELAGCRLVVVGDGDVLGAARELAERVGVADRVEFVGRVPFERLPAYMAAADLGLVMLRNLCLNYRYALPNRVFDFIGAGLPILACRLPEIEKIVEGEDVGMCMERLTAKDMAEAVRLAEAHPDMLERWRSNMLRLAPTLTWEAETAELVGMLTMVCVPKIIADGATINDEQA